MPALDLDDNLGGFAAGIVDEVDHPVNALVTAFLAGPAAGLAAQIYTVLNPLSPSGFIDFLDQASDN